MLPRGGVVRGRARTRPNSRGTGGALGNSSTRNGQPVRGGNTQSTTRGGGAPAQRGRGTTLPRGSLQTFARGGKIHGATSSAAPSPAPSRPSTAQGPVGTFQQRYDVLKKSRETERANAIRDGFLADPDRPRTLAEAITPVGTCPDMCPEFERVERVVQNDVWPSETDPATADAQGTSKRLPDEARMVKKFRRAAAGLDEQLPSDLRPPHVLKKTLDYLFNDLLEKASSLSQVHHFIWDRTRAVRNDFSIQQVSKVVDLQVTIECYERIARFHILSLHQLALAEKPYEQYVAQQEREQLDKTLLSLMQLYEDSRARLTSPNEPEFRAYCIIFQIQNPIPDLEDRVQTWPKNIATHPRVQRALLLYAAATNTADMQGPLKPRISHPIAQANWRKFWALIQSKELSYLMACVGEIYFGLVRRTALNAIWRSYRTAGIRKVEDWTLGDLVEVFGFETQDQVQTFCEDQGFTIAVREDGAAYLDLGSVTGRTLPDAPASKQGQQKSDVVERKRYGRALSAVINGLSVREAKAAGLVEQADTTMANHAAEESLFITDKSDDEMFPRRKSKQGLAQKASAETKVQPLNPFASSFNPARASPATQTSKPPQSSFGFGTQVAQPFGTPAPSNAFTNGFGSPAPTNHEAVRAAGTQAQAATNGFSSNSAFASPRSSPAASTILADSKVEPATALSATQTLQGAAKTPFSFGSTPPMSASQSSPFHATQAQPTSPFSTHPSKDVNPPSQQQLPAFSSSNHTSFSSLTNGLPAFGAAAQNKGVEQNKETPATSFPSPILPTTPASSVAAVPASPKISSQPSFSSQPPLPTFNFGATTSSNTTPQSPFVPNSMSSQPNPSQGTPTAVSQVFAQPFAQPTPQPTGPSSEELRRQAKAKEAVATRKSALLDQIAGALLNEPHGLLDQFIEFAATPMIAQARQQVLQEKENHQADDFRMTVLSHRYGRRWRQLTINHKLARQGRDRRRRLARDVEARSQRSRESSITSQVDAFRESFRSSRSSLASSVLVNDPTPQALDDKEQDETASDGKIRSQTGPQATTSSMSTSNRANVVTGLSNITPFSPSQARTSRRTRDSAAPSRLSMTSPSVTSTSRHDTTRSTYFKLKALGLDPNSATLHTSTNSMLAATPKDRKRPRTDSFGTSIMSGKRLTTASTSPLARSTYLQDDAVATPPTSTSGTIPPPVNTDDDDELLVAARQVRQAMTESISLFQEEIAKDELQQSQSRKAEPLTRLSKSLSAQDFRASIASFASLAPLPSTERTSKFVELPPRYRNRVSKFLPRERHGDVQAHRRRTIGTRSRGGTPNPLRDAALEAAVAEKTVANGVKSPKEEVILLDDEDDDVQGSARAAISPSVEHLTQPMAIDPQPTQFGPITNGSSSAFTNHLASTHPPSQVFDLDSYQVPAEEFHPTAQPAIIPTSEAVFGRPYAPEAASFAKLNNDIVVSEVPTPAQTLPANVSFLQPSPSHKSPPKSASPQPQLLPQTPPQKAPTRDPRKRPTPPVSLLPPAEPSPLKPAPQDPRKRPSPALPSQVVSQAPPPKPGPRDPRQRPQPSAPSQTAPQALPQKAVTRDPRQRPAQPVQVQSPKLKQQPKQQPPRRQVSAPHVNPFALLEGMGDDDDEDDEDGEGEDENDEEEAADDDVAMEQDSSHPDIQNNTFVAANAMQQLQAGPDTPVNHYLNPSQLDGGMWDDHGHAPINDEAGYSKYFSESEDEGEGEGYEYDDAGMGPGGEVAFDDDDEGEDEDEEEEGYDEEDDGEDYDEDEEDDDDRGGAAAAVAWGAANGGKSGASVEDAIEL